MKILHTADIHLREYGDDRWKTLQKLVKVGKKEKIKILVISGDLFDKGIDAKNLKTNLREIFSNNDFKIILIPGNHDINSYPIGMDFGRDVEILRDSSASYKDKDVKIWGMPFEPIEGEKILNKLRSLANNLTPDKKNILVYHGELLDTFFSRKDFGDEGRGRYMPVKLSYFKDLNVDYVLAGHFHSRFDYWKLENDGYFVYPGSPVSITKREMGQRKVNIFEVGEPPKEYSLDTPHFEKVVIEFDPYKDKKPTETVKKCFNNLHPEAKIILTVKGFINGEAIGIDEIGLRKQLYEIVKNKCDVKDFHYKVDDIRAMLEDDLFKNFIKELERTNYEEKKKKQMRGVAIEAMKRMKS